MKTAPRKIMKTAAAAAAAAKPSQAKPSRAERSEVKISRFESDQAELTVPTIRFMAVNQAGQKRRLNFAIGFEPMVVYLSTCQSWPWRSPFSSLTVW